jgi:hypothetical protein
MLAKLKTDNQGKLTIMIYPTDKDREKLRLELGKDREVLAKIEVREIKEY